MRVLLDTNAYTAMMHGHSEVAAKVRQANRLTLSTIVVGELLHGFYNGSQFETNLARLKAFLASPFVRLLPVTMTTADRFGRISTALRRRGTPLPTNDVWIAAHAMETGSDLLSADAHFEAVEGLAWVPFRPS